MSSVFYYKQFFLGICMLRIAETPNGHSLTKPRRYIQLIAGLFLAIGSFLFGVVTTNAVIFDFVKVQTDPAPLCVPL